MLTSAVTSSLAACMASTPGTFLSTMSLGLVACSTACHTPAISQEAVRLAADRTISQYTLTDTDLALMYVAFIKCGILSAVSLGLQLAAQLATHQPYHKKLFLAADQIISQYTVADTETALTHVSCIEFGLAVTMSLRLACSMACHTLTGSCVRSCSPRDIW